MRCGVVVLRGGGVGQPGGAFCMSAGGATRGYEASEQDCFSPLPECHEAEDCSDLREGIAWELSEAGASAGGRLERPSVAHSCW